MKFCKWDQFVLRTKDDRIVKVCSKQMQRDSNDQSKNLRNIDRKHAEEYDRQDNLYFTQAIFFF